MEKRGVERWAVEGGGCSSARGIPGTECLDHREKNYLGVALKRQEVAEQEKESTSGRNSRMRIPKGKVRKCEHSWKLWKVGELFFSTCGYWKPCRSLLDPYGLNKNSSTNPCPWDRWSALPWRQSLALSLSLSPHPHSKGHLGAT